MGIPKEDVDLAAARKLVFYVSAKRVARGRWEKVASEIL